jgi:hypothetical protein
MIPQLNPVFTSTNAITTAPGSNRIYPSQPKLFSESISYCQLGHFPAKAASAAEMTTTTTTTIGTTTTTH